MSAPEPVFEFDMLKMRLAHYMNEPASYDKLEQVVKLQRAVRHMGLGMKPKSSANQAYADVLALQRRVEREIAKTVRVLQSAGLLSLNQGNGFAMKKKGLPKQSDFGIKADELAGNITAGPGWYHLYDDRTDAEFEKALAEAIEDGLPSRRAVAIKMGQYMQPRYPSQMMSKSPANTKAKIAYIRRMAAQGASPEQIAVDLGYIGVEHLRTLANQHGIEFTADRAIARTQRKVDSNRVCNEVISTIDGLAAPIRLINFDELDDSQVAHWQEQLTDALRTVNQFARKLREHANDHSN